MTRLQKMLSQVKTVDELAELLRVSPSYITDVTGIAKDREKLIPCRINCHECALYQCGHCISNYTNISEYLNTEIREPNHKPSTPVIAMRDSALKKLQAKFNEACKTKAEPLVTSLLLDMLCDMLEDIGLFEPDECHNELIRITKEKHS